MTNTQQKPLKVLVVGAGRRVQNNFLPVLKYLENTFELVGIHARTLERLQPLSEKWGTTALLTITDSDLTNIDVVVVSVPTAQNAIVLKKLEAAAANLTLIIDTPVVWNFAELVAAYPLLMKFKRVIVTEDYMNFPPFELLRKAVSSGLIGKLEGITLLNTGYMYHGLALLRSFDGFSAAKRSSKRSVGALSEVIEYSFAAGYRAHVVGPYRGHMSGGIVVAGREGSISEFPSDAAKGTYAGKPIYLLASNRDANGHIASYSIAGASHSLHRDLPELRTLASMDFPDKSDLNLLRGCGLLAVFRSVCSPDGLNDNYGLHNAIYDSFVSRLAKVGRLPFDPLTLVGSNVVRIIEVAASILNI